MSYDPATLVGVAAISVPVVVALVTFMLKVWERVVRIESKVDTLMSVWPIVEPPRVERNNPP